ncbi:GNAT family N-acetyltransferase [Candidatus Woesearchaeota archaeon]|nr:GNAT family N-acetyltransferase [Candidatus Woesearchaeota archaeon]
MIDFKIVTDLEECRKLWNSFPDDDYLFDEWDYRVCFFDPNIHQLHFIAGYKGKDLVGVIPLWREKGKDYYEWFGGELPEHSHILLKDYSLLPEFIKKIPEDSWLAYSEPVYADFFPGCSTDTVFFLDLRKHSNSLENYFSTFGKKHRKNITRDLKMLSAKNPLIARNRLEDFDRMIALNRDRFVGESFFDEEHFVNGMRKVLERALSRDELEMLSILIDGKMEAAEAAIFTESNKRYTVILGGNNLKVNNIGKLMTVEHIKNAISKGAIIVDFLSHDCGWKKLWNLEEENLCEIDI